MRRVISFIVFGLLTAGLVLVHAQTYTVQGTVTGFSSSPQLTAVDPYAKPDRPNPLNPERPYWYVVDQSGLKVLRFGTNTVLGSVAWPATYELAQPDGTMLNVPAPSVALPNGTLALNWEPVRLMLPSPGGEDIGPEAVSGATTLAFVVMAHSGYEWRSSNGVSRDTIAPMASEETESSLLFMIDVSNPAQPVVHAGALLGHEAGQMAWDPNGGAMHVANMPSKSLPPNLESFISKITPPEAGAEPAPPYSPNTLYPLCGPEIQWSGEAKVAEKTGIPVNEPEVWACDTIHGAGEGEGPFTYKFEGLPTWLIAHGIDPNTGEGDGILYGTPTEVGIYSFKVTVTDHAPEADGVTAPKTASAVFTIEAKPTVTEFAAGEMEVEAGITTALPLWGTGTCDVVAGMTLVPAWFEVVPVTGGCIVLMNNPPLQGEFYDFTMPNLTRIDTRTGVAYPGPWRLSAEVLGTYGFDSLPAGVGFSGLAWHEVDMIPGEPDKYNLNGEFIGVDAFTGQLYNIVIPYEQSDTIEEVGPPSMVIETNEISTEGPPLIDYLGMTADPNVKVFGDLVVEADRDIYVSVPVAKDGAVIKVSGGVASTINLNGVQASYLALDSDLEPAVKPDLGGLGQIDHGILWATGPSSGDVAVVDTAAGTVRQTLSTGANSLGGVAVDSVSIGLAYVAGLSLQNVILFGNGNQWTSAPMIATINPAEALVDPTVMTVGEPGLVTIVAIGWPIPALSVTGTVPGLSFADNGNGTLTVSGTPIAAGIYTLTATATNTAGSSSQAFTITVNPRMPPAIISVNTATLMVDIASQFKVDATGTPTPNLTVSGTLPAGVTFHDNAACSPAIPAGCTGSAFLGGLPTSTGTYPLTITASNSEGTVTQAFTLNVGAYDPTVTQPAVTTHPANQTVIEGDTAIFTSAATGNPLPAVQWQLLTTASGAWGDIAGATSTSYITGPTTTSMNGYQYRAVFTNSAGTATTSAASLTVNATTGEPVITIQPATATITVGQTATFTTAATGDPMPTVVWQQSTNSGSSWANIAGATTNSYTTPVTTKKMNGYQYRAVFTNIKGSATSKVASLVFNKQNRPITSGNGFIKVSLDVGSEPEGIAVNPVTHKAYILSRDIATNTKNVVVVDNDVLNALDAPKKLELPLGAAMHSPTLIPIHNDHEYLTIDSNRNLIYVPTKYAVPDTEPGEPPEEGDEPAAEVMGTLTAIDGNTNAVLAFYEFPKGVMPEGVAVDPVNNVVYVAVKFPEPHDIGSCPIDPVSGEADCELSGGMIYAFNAANVRAGTLGSPIAAIPSSEDPESLVFDPVHRLVYAANEGKGTTTVAHAVDSQGTPEGNRIGFVPIWTTPGFAASGPNPYALPCSPYEADKMAVGSDGSVYITDDKSRVAKIMGTTVVGMTQIDLPGGDNTPLYCYGEEPVQGLNTANNIGFMQTDPDPLTGEVIKNVYVVSEQNTVSILDPAALALKATIVIPGATHLDAIAVDGSMTRVWITDEVGLSGTETGGAVFVLNGACANGKGNCVQ